MTPAAPDVPQTTTTTVERTGTTLTVISTVVFLGVLGYWLYAALTGNVSLTQDQLKATLTAFVIATSVSAVIALVATGLNLPGLRSPRLGRGLSTFFSGATLITAVLFLLLTVLPHANLANFALSFQDKCQTPLNKITADITKAANDATNATSDNAFITVMTQDAESFQADATNATGKNTTDINTLKPPQSKYQSIIDDCAAQFAADASFLTGPGVIPLPTTLPPPIGGMKINAHDLLQDSALLVQGDVPGLNLKLPASVVSPAVTLALNTATSTCTPLSTRLEHEGIQLQADAYSPFKPAKSFISNC